MSVPTILFVSGWLWNTVPAGVQGMVHVPWFDSRAAFSVRPWSLPSRRPWSDGPSRLWLCQSEKSDEQGSYVPRLERRGVGVGSSAWARPSDRRGRPEAAGARIERSGRIGGPKQLTSGRCSSWARPSGRLLDRPFALLFLDSRVELWRGSRSSRDPGFMNPTHVF